ncbi:MAG: hypothetical protein ACFFC7_06810 [Candidatus Hermodarchaeota archaeon]
MNKINSFLHDSPLFASAFLTLVVIIPSILLSFFVPTLRKIMLEDLQLWDLQMIFGMYLFQMSDFNSAF